MSCSSEGSLEVTALTADREFTRDNHSYCMLKAYCESRRHQWPPRSHSPVLVTSCSVHYLSACSRGAAAETAGDQEEETGGSEIARRRKAASG